MYHVSRMRFRWAGFCGTAVVLCLIIAAEAPSVRGWTSTTIYFSAPPQTPLTGTASGTGCGPSVCPNGGACTAYTLGGVAGALYTQGLVTYCADADPTSTSGTGNVTQVMPVGAASYNFLWVNGTGSFSVKFSGVFHDGTGADARTYGSCASSTEQTWGRTAVTAYVQLTQTSPTNVNVASGSFTVYDTGLQSCPNTAGAGWNVGDPAGNHAARHTFAAVSLTNNGHYYATFQLACQSWANLSTVAGSTSAADTDCEINYPPPGNVWFEMTSITIT